MTTSDSRLNTQHLIIHTDGGSRGNPGPAATGIVIFSPSFEVIHEFGVYLGTGTNNEAEYTAVINALEWIIANHSLPFPTLLFKLDSKLVVEQVSHNWKIKEPRLQQFATKVWELIKTNGIEASFTYIPRAENTCADRQVNITLDNNLGV